jgi:hypothetical protein
MRLAIEDVHHTLVLVRRDLVRADTEVAAARLFRTFYNKLVVLREPRAG